MNSVTTSYSAASLYQSLSATSQSSSVQALVDMGSALQQAGPVDPSSRPPPPDPEANADYAELENAAQSGNLAGAQAALMKLQLALSEPQSHTHNVGGTVPSPTQVSPESTTPSDSSESGSTSGNYVNVTV